MTAVHPLDDPVRSSLAGAHAPFARWVGRVARYDPEVSGFVGGTYLGLRDGGRLIAMAGERLHPRGWTEISAVCTDPDFRGLGLATRLIRAVGHGIRARGDVPFLHTSAANHRAIRLYDTLGFHLRQRSTLTLVRTPVGS